MANLCKKTNAEYLHAPKRPRVFDSCVGDGVILVLCGLLFMFDRASKDVRPLVVVLAEGERCEVPCKFQARAVDEDNLRLGSDRRITPA